MNLEGDCRNRHISVFTLVLYKCLLYSYIIFKTETNDRERKTPCVYEQSTASGVNILNSRPCHQRNWHLLLKTAMYTHSLPANQEFKQCEYTGFK